MNGFIKPKGNERLLEEYRRECDPARDFLLTHYEYDPQAKVTTASAYRFYQQWCEQNGNKPMSSQQFGIAVRSVFPKVEKPRANREGKRFHVYSGLSQISGFEGPSL